MISCRPKLPLLRETLYISNEAMALHSIVIIKITRFPCHLLLCCPQKQQLHPSCQLRRELASTALLHAS